MKIDRRIKHLLVKLNKARNFGVNWILQFKLLKKKSPLKHICDLRRIPSSPSANPFFLTGFQESNSFIMANQFPPFLFSWQWGASGCHFLSTSEEPLLLNCHIVAILQAKPESSQNFLRKLVLWSFNPKVIFKGSEPPPSCLRPFQWHRFKRGSICWWVLSSQARTLED